MREVIVPPALDPKRALRLARAVEQLLHVPRGNNRIVCAVDEQDRARHLGDLAQVLELVERNKRVARHDAEGRAAPRGGRGGRTGSGPGRCWRATTPEPS